MQTLNLKLLVVAPLLLSAFGAEAAESGARYKRVVVVGDDAGTNIEAKLAIADGFASAVERAVNLNVARVMYGRRAGKDPGVTAPMAFVIRTLEDMGTALNETFMSNSTYEQYLIRELEARAKTDPWAKEFDTSKMPFFSRLGSSVEQALESGEQRQLTYEVLTLPADVELPEPEAGSVAARVKDSGLMLTGILLQAARIGDAKEYDKILDLYDQADAFTAVSQAVANEKNLYKVARDVYVESLADEAKAWTPLYFSVTLGYGPQGVQPSMRVILRPGPGMGGPVGIRGAAYDALPPDKKVVDVRTMDYIPHFSYKSDAPAAMAINVSGNFGSGTQRRPIARINWGRMPVPTDIRTITQCLTACDDDLAQGNIGRHYPTINGQLRFEFIEVMAVNSEPKRWWGRFKDGVKKRVNAAVQYGANFAGSVTEKGHFHLLIQQLAIELGSDSMRVIPNESMFTLGIGDGKKALTINPVSNTVGGVDLRMVGIDLYAKVGPEVAAAFSSEINAKFSKDKLLNDGDFNDKQLKILKSLEPIVKALNSY